MSKNKLKIKDLKVLRKTFYVYKSITFILEEKRKLKTLVDN